MMFSEILGQGVILPGYQSRRYVYFLGYKAGEIFPGILWQE
jgi:hypothetical protein